MATVPVDVVAFEAARAEVTRVAGLFATYIMAANPRLPDTAELTRLADYYGGLAFQSWNIWNKSQSAAFTGANMFELFRSEFTGALLTAYATITAALP